MILKVIHMWLVVSAGRVAGKVDTGNTSVKVRHSPALGVKIAESGSFFCSQLLAVNNVDVTPRKLRAQNIELVREG